MKTLVFYIALLAALPLTAQTSLTVTYTSGKVYYYPPQQNNPSKIYPGLTLSSEGRVRCEQNSKVKLLCKGKTFELKDTKTYYLEEIAKEAGSTSSLSFMGRFWGFMTGSMEATEDQEHMEEHHRKSMENLHAGVKGYASKDFEIQTDMLYEGSLSDQGLEFNWTTKAATPYCFRLTQQSDDAVVLLCWTRANSLHLNLGDLALTDGAAYEWQILTKVGDPEAPHSRKMQFIYSPKAAAKALTDATGQASYQTASPVEQKLMELYSLEANNFFYDAYKSYAKLATDNPEDILVKRAYAAFLVRIDRIEAAKELIK